MGDLGGGLRLMSLSLAPVFWCGLMLESLALLACCCLRLRMMLAGGELRASLSVAVWTRRWLAGWGCSVAAADAAWFRVSCGSLCTAFADDLVSATAAAAAAAGLCGSSCDLPHYWHHFSCCDFPHYWL